ncbi:unnamed protein product [Rotaria sp. Silwood1]|nr:unnamed protein product [Rotaria sp. Silwood1]CAF4751282.1 unnamed protein product [Rotaria sp. Silwood1]
MLSNVELLPMYLLSDAMDCTKIISTKEDINSHDYQSNSNSSDQEPSLDDYVIVSSSESIISIENNNSEEKILVEEEEDDDDLDYFAQFSFPDDDSDYDLEYVYNNDNNDDIYINNHLNRKQLSLVNQFEETNYQRSKRSNKKINARCQIKTKHAKTIKIKSHNKQLYMHHRLIKRVKLDEPSRNYLSSNSSTPLHSSETLRSLAYEARHPEIFSNDQKQKPIHNNNNNNTSNVSHQFREYTINEHNLLHDPSFDDAMINFLLDMQNRDLSPNDYEMLLRLDERVQRKTVDVHILDKFPTLDVSDIHLNDQCTICMETFTLKQKLKSLPCTHIFHVHCIETYLKEFSTQCPLDNLPLI